jgi:hypothetical protein
MSRWVGSFRQILGYAPHMGTLRMRRAAPVAALALVLSGCGAATKTVVLTSLPPSAKTTLTTAKATSPPPPLACSNGVTANSHASCAFASNVLAAYASATTERNGIVSFAAESPTTHQTYPVACTTGGHERIACRTTDAEVTLSFAAIEHARATSPAAREREALERKKRELEAQVRTSERAAQVNPSEPPPSQRSYTTPSGEVVPMTRQEARDLELEEQTRREEAKRRAEEGG